MTRSFRFRRCRDCHLRIIWHSFSALFDIRGPAAVEVAASSHCVNLSPSLSVTQYIFALNPANRAVAVPLQNRTFEQCTQPLQRPSLALKGGHRNGYGVIDRQVGG